MKNTFKFVIVIVMILFVKLTCFATNNDYLYPRGIEASSYLSQGDFLIKDNYHPYYLIDENPNTTWAVRTAESGIGERVFMYYSLPKNENIFISIKNGYQKSEDLFNKNNRVKELEVKLTSGTINNPKTTSQIYTLKDERGWQQFTVSF